MAKPPILISGMHRSGTSLFSSLMQDSGMLIGKDLDQNFESIFIYNINEKLLEMLGATWDNPISFTKVSKQQSKELLITLESQLKRKGTIRYLGLIKWITTGINISKVSGVWGWKDPRNTITWPIWKMKFPHAKVIHIVRNPIDVAISLHKREVLKKKKVEKEQETGPIKVYSELAQSFKYCLALWNQYEDEAEKMINKYPHDVYVMRYEDLLSQPRINLERVLSFINEKELKISKINLDKIDFNNAYQFLNHKKNMEPYDKMRSNKHVIRYGYDSLLFK